MRTALAILSVVALFGPTACASAPRKGGCVGLNCGFVLDQPPRQPAPLTDHFHAGKVVPEDANSDVAPDQAKDQAASDTPEGLNEDGTPPSASPPFTLRAHSHGAPEPPA